MRKFFFLIASAFLMLASATPASAIQCVPYAREISGINLKGDAWQWWNAAQGVYDRGRTPRDGAVLVFTRQGAMHHGHVSVVTRVMSNRLVLVDHANWAPARTSGRGAVTTAVPVLDVSPKNDWTQVRVWFQPAADFGNRIYRTDGYVYHPNAPHGAKPGLHKVALSRAAEMFPGDKALTRQVEPKRPDIRTEVTAKAEPAAVKTEAATVLVKAETVAVLAKPEPVAASHSTSNDMVKTARTVFRRQNTPVPSILAGGMFN